MQSSVFEELPETRNGNDRLSIGIQPSKRNAVRLWMAAGWESAIGRPIAIDAGAGRIGELDHPAADSAAKARHAARIRPWIPSAPAGSQQQRYNAPHIPTNHIIQQIQQTNKQTNKQRRQSLIKLNWETEKINWSPSIL